MLVLLFGIYLLVIAILFFLQEALIFPSTRLAAEYQYYFPSSFTEFNLENEGISLNALHLKVENPKGVILYFHGNRGDLSRWGKVVQPLLKYNYDVILMDYRGYGKSGGEPSELPMYSDADLFYQYCKEEFAENQIVVYGRSIGSAFATYVAANNSPKQLILETPFYSLSSVVKKRFPFLPTDYLLRYQFQNNLYVADIKCPSLIFLAGEDEVIPYENGLKLAEIFEKAKTVTIKEGKHNTLTQEEIYWKNLTAFISN